MNKSVTKRWQEYFEKVLNNYEENNSADDKDQTIFEEPIGLQKGTEALWI